MFMRYNAFILSYIDVVGFYDSMNNSWSGDSQRKRLCFCSFPTATQSQGENCSVGKLNCAVNTDRTDPRLDEDPGC